MNSPEQIKETIHSGMPQPKVSGIYQIQNKINGRKYIGSAIDLERRKRQHFYQLKNNKHKNKYLQNDFNKCEQSNFVFEILERMENKEWLLYHEQAWLNVYFDNQNDCYNISSKAGNFDGNHSVETKRKISNAMRGKKKSRETKTKISNSMKRKRERTFELFCRENG